ncbi:sigma-70 family RNA polymerase sigma factor [Massilia sp. WF1]|uniref:RNA polymerase sigma factor n=1 Tax=unclassified Massilia TaxID=2609279 RepID=UPI00064A6246|nr:MULTISPECIES: RNA polymerase sigma factor [unclassified Massilia]ALK95583.1 RNA polymerase subunit sigma-70 [Massilia sp. WG5]KLU35245.1 sigma-70 family RNA polymerase sigma factor [Massilia sp. WF1]
MNTTSATSDSDLLRAMRGGAADAFAALYRRHQGPLYRFAALRCGSPASAADVVQEVFMGLMTGRFCFDPLRGTLQAFLFGVARMLILKLEEGRRRHVALPDALDHEDGADDGPELPLDEGGPLARLLDNEAAEQVRRALAHLAPHYRDVVILYEMHELSYAEIADICQVDIGTVRSRLSRGRAALARRLAGWRAAPDLAQA